MYDYSSYNTSYTNNETANLFRRVLRKYNLTFKIILQLPCRIY